MERKPGAWVIVNEETGEVAPDLNDPAMAERCKKTDADEITEGGEENV